MFPSTVGKIEVTIMGDRIVTRNRESFTVSEFEPLIADVPENDLDGIIDGDYDGQRISLYIIIYLVGENEIEARFKNGWLDAWAWFNDYEREMATENITAEDMRMI